jgi:Zn-dependent peptidase ImmA (M78 family)
MSLPKSRINIIENIARDVLVEAYQKSDEKLTPPIKLKKVLKANNLDLQLVTFKKEEILGAYDKTEKAIYVAENETYTRKAFTIAHELGHFFLHQQRDADFFYRAEALQMEQDAIEETEANAFAAALLMPKNLVKRYWEQFKSTTIIAYMFKVSHIAAHYRLVNLGLKDKNAV